MSFICERCRNLLLENKGLAIGLSHGPCENCHEYTMCYDLKLYNYKKNWKELLEKEIKSNGR